MKTMKKVVSILLTLAMLATMMSVALAFPDDLTNVEADPGVSGLSAGVVKILGIIRWVGFAFAIGMLVYIGIKYMMSAANEKADLKKGLINYVIGAVLVGAVSTICGWIADFADTLSN